MEFDMNVAGITFGFWIFCMLMIWKFQFEGMEWQLMPKIVVSVVSLPLFYLVINFQLNR